MFGKLMSISDEMMWPYYDLVTDQTPEEIAALAAKVKSGALHPMDVKMSLAQEIIAGFHGEDAAEKAAAEFQRVFRDREAPEEMKEFIAGKRKARWASYWRVHQGRTMVQGAKKRVQAFNSGLEKWLGLRVTTLGASNSASEAERS